MLGEGKGDIEFFARRIVDTHSDKIEDIEKNHELIKKLGKFTETTLLKSLSFSPVELQTPDITRTSSRHQHRNT